MENIIQVKSIEHTAYSAVYFNSYLVLYSTLFNTLLYTLFSLSLFYIYSLIYSILFLHSTGQKPLHPAFEAMPIYSVAGTSTQVFKDPLLSKCNQPSKPILVMAKLQIVFASFLHGQYLLCFHISMGQN